MPTTAETIFLAYLHPYEITASFHKSLLDLIGFDLTGPRRLASWAQIKCGPLGIEEGRNDACRKMLESDSDWLLFIDSDMGFAPYTLELLMSVADAADRPLVGGLCFAQREIGSDGYNGFRCYPQPTIFDYLKHDDGFYRFTGRTHFPVNQAVKCDATGAAMLLIHRSVLEAVREKHGERWFNRLPDPSGKDLQGEDVSFFSLTRECGFPVWVHTGIRTTHFKNLWLGEQDFWQSFVAPPAEDRVDVIIPCLTRPKNVEPLMKSLRATTGLATAWWVCEDGDNEQIRTVEKWGGEVISSPGVHTFAEKVNLAYDYIGETIRPAPWLLLCGDDVRFRPGWLDQAQDVARRYRAKVVGTNDLANPRVLRGEHATHPLIWRDYVAANGASLDGPGVVCHEGYRHWFVDDEIVSVAKARGVFQAALGSEVEHLHPLAGKAKSDDVYAVGLKHIDQDKALYERRMRKLANDSSSAEGSAAG